VAPGPPPSYIWVVPRLALALALAVLVPAARADAYAIGGFPWPQGEVTYFTAASAYRPAVDRAARAWNRTGVGVMLTPTSRRRAKVVVAYGGPPCSGVAPVGSPRRARHRTVMRLGAGCSRRWIRIAAVHEFGHVLGLDHVRGVCARMSPGVHPDGTPFGCRRRTLSYWLRRPLLRDDLRGARVLYEGEWNWMRRPRRCFAPDTR